MRALVWIGFGVVVLGLAVVAAVEWAGRSLSTGLVAPVFALLLWTGLVLLALGLAGLTRPRPRR